MRNYFYRLLCRYISLFVRPNDQAILLAPPDEPWQDAPFKRMSLDSFFSLESDQELDYIILSSEIHFHRDIQGLFSLLHDRCTESTRLIVTYYSSLWKPLLQLASWAGLRRKTPEQNWISQEDVENLLLLSNFEAVRTDSKVLIPVWIPFISNFVNRYLLPLPVIRELAMVNVLIARPRVHRKYSECPSVSIIVPARNEAGNIDAIVKRIPQMGPDDELIFIEGNSTDDTWQRIREIKERSSQKILIAQQEGKGKGDAVRKGFSLASKEILMILDADMTVPPEDLSKFYWALHTGKGEFINGSRLVYPMEGNAMRFANMIANKFFAMAFSYVIGQKFKDTLCGTKVISRDNYMRLAAHRGYFGNFDPFGDFDLIFGAARMGLKIVEVPIVYRDRTYGTTNISRWKHGVILLGMLIFAARRIRFL